MRTTTTTTTLTSALLLAYAHTALAANDWSVPCTDGTCEYDLAASNTTAGGNVKIVCFCFHMWLVVDF
jgi:hypothetical protein